MVGENESSPRLKTLRGTDEAMRIVVIFGDDGTEIPNEVCEQEKVHEHSGEDIEGSRQEKPLQT